MANKEIRDRARIENIRFWMIAQKLGITASTYTIWLRTELPDEKKQLVMDAIDQIINDRGGKVHD